MIKKYFKNNKAAQIKYIKGFYIIKEKKRIRDIIKSEKDR
jgi:hypothetical protein